MPSPPPPHYRYPHRRLPPPPPPLTASSPHRRLPSPPPALTAASPHRRAQAIHTRWSYWEESGDEGGVKLCKRCFSDLKATSTADRVLSEIAHRNVKIDNFLEKKEKDRPEYVDNWVQCDECHSWLHWTCAMYKGEDTPEDCLFFCGNCRRTRGKTLPKELCVAPSEDLAETVLSKKLQDGLKKELAASGVKAAPVTIRVVSNIDCFAKIAPPPPLPGTAAAHSAAKNGAKVALQNGKVGGREFPYRSKCILAFQRMQGGDGPEVCFFAMYVQEYGSECPEPNTNRVYISYLDSVRYFKSAPEGQRTTVYHSILINYLDYARGLGFEHGHIWVSPPKQGDDYIFYAHPEVMLQKRMGLLKLKEWYEKMLIIAKDKGVIADFQERPLPSPPPATPPRGPRGAFQHPRVGCQDMLDAYKDIESASDIPVFSGDHWAASIALKIQELKNKEKELAKKKGGGHNGKGSKAASGSGVHADIKQEEALLNQIQEEMRSMRNHFIVVTLAEQRQAGKRNKVRLARGSAPRPRRCTAVARARGRAARRWLTRCRSCPTSLWTSGRRSSKSARCTTGSLTRRSTRRTRRSCCSTTCTACTGPRRPRAKRPPPPTSPRAAWVAPARAASSSSAAAPPRSRWRCRTGRSCSTTPTRPPPRRRGICRPRSSSCGSSRKSTSRSATSCRKSITSAATRPRPPPPAPSSSACSSGVRAASTLTPHAHPTPPRPAQPPAAPRRAPRRARAPGPDASPRRRRRIAESFMSCLHNMQANRQLPNAAAPGAARSAPETMGR